MLEKRTTFALGLFLLLCTKSPAPIINGKPSPMIPPQSQAQLEKQQQFNGAHGEVGTVVLKESGAVVETPQSDQKAKHDMAVAEKTAAGDPTQVLQEADRRMKEEEQKPARQGFIGMLIVGMAVVGVIGFKRWVDTTIPDAGPSTKKIRW